jgi:uncharacterized protein
MVVWSLPADAARDASALRFPSEKNDRPNQIVRNLTEVSEVCPASQEKGFQVSLLQADHIHSFSIFDRFRRSRAARPFDFEKSFETRARAQPRSPHLARSFPAEQNGSGPSGCARDRFAYTDRSLVSAEAGTSRKRISVGCSGNEIQIEELRMLRVVLSSTSRLVHLAVGTPMACRFEPSCSIYSAEAIRRHGPIRGAFLALKRVCRCNPLGGSGYDPVPTCDERKK